MSVASAPSTPVAATRSSPIHRALTDADVSELCALMAASYRSVGALLGDLAALDEDLARDTANAKLRQNSAIIVSLLKDLSDKEVAGQVAVGDRKVLVAVAGDAGAAARKQHAKFARAIKLLFLQDCDGAFAPRSTPRSAPPSSVLSAALGATPTGAPSVGAAAVGSAARADLLIQQSAMISVVENQLGQSVSLNSMPSTNLIQLVKEAWNANKPRALSLAECINYLGPRESASDYVVGEKPDMRATRISAEFLRLLLAYAIGTAQSLPATVGGLAVALTVTPRLDGGTGLVDKTKVLGLKVCMALVVHASFTLAIRNASYAQAYELRARLCAAMVRIQAPMSMPAITITAAYAKAMDEDDLKLASAEDAKASLPAAEKEKKVDPKDDDDDDKKKKKAAADKKKGTAGRGRGRGGHGDYRRGDRSRSPDRRSPDRRDDRSGRGGRRQVDYNELRNHGREYERRDGRDRDRRAPARRS